MLETLGILRPGRVPLPVGRAGFKAHRKLNKSTGFSKTAIDIADCKSVTYRRFGKLFERLWRVLNEPLGPGAWLLLWVIACALGVIFTAWFWRELGGVQ